MKNYILIQIFLIVFMTGCFTSYKNHVNVSLKSSDNANIKLFSIIESIAIKHGLTKDFSNSITGEKVSFMGDPYHYYIFEIKDDECENITVNFTHIAMLSGSSKSPSEPEKDFLEKIKETFRSDIKQLDYNFIESPN